MRKDNKIQAKRKRPARKELLRAKRGKKVLKKNSPSKLLPRPPTIKKKKKKNPKSWREDPNGSVITQVSGVVQVGSKLLLTAFDGPIKVVDVPAALA